jgi:Icc-related predicted phosphoesterase
MRIIATSDWHGMYGSTQNLPMGDVLCVSGDVFSDFVRRPTLNRVTAAARQWNQWDTEIKDWFASLLHLPYKHIVWTLGNHDFIGENTDFLAGLKATQPKNCHLLHNSSVEIDGVRFWGTPYSGWFWDWAFNAPEEESSDQTEPFLEEIYKGIPKGTDVVLSHGPARGYGDKVNYPQEGEDPHVGSFALVRAIEKIKPQLVVTGHIHEGYGKYQHGPTTIVNACRVNLQYEVVNDPHIIDIKPKAKS